VNDAPTHPDLAAEQAAVDHAYACLDTMRERAEYIKDLGYLGGDVMEGGYITPENRAYWELDKQRRIDALTTPTTALCFGRIDRVDEERFYIGRRHVEGPDGEAVIVDWRTSTATPFYRATFIDPLGLRLRRRFVVEGRHLIDLFDEDFNNPHATDASAYVPDPLLAELEHARTGQMRDIVATIQAEQDVVIRAPIGDAIVVQGGPGTGKTAVGLHRAAFLLYEHRELLEREQLLVIGPNRLFLRYISQVLPSLGETAAAQATLEALVAARYVLRGTEPAEVARLKGDPRMVEVVRRAVLAHISPPKDDLKVTTSFGSVTLTSDEVAEVIEPARDRAVRMNDSREAVRRQLLELAWRRHRRRSGADPGRRAPFIDEVRGNRQFKAGLDKAWPSLSGTAVIRKLYGNRNLMTEAANGVLSADEQRLLARRPSTRVAQEQWTRGDLGLLDEVDAMVGNLPRRYGHVVVDEAQDLSAMEMRMVGRRSLRGSMTILGDLAQATAPASQSRWEAAAEHLMLDETRISELTIGYRVPAPILDFANRLLSEAAPHVAPSQSVRRSGDPPLISHVSEGERLPVVTGEAARMAHRWSAVAVVAPESMLDDVAAEMTASGLDFVDARSTSELADHLTLLSPRAVKGLEFDAVLVVEPGRIVTEEDSGLRVLYVVLTRAVQHLTIIHAEPLPPVLR
jgi:DNA helicase IV